MRSSIGIDVKAPPAVVFELARQVERWHELLPHYVRSRARARSADGAVVVEFVARRPPLPLIGLRIPVAWRARTSSDPLERQLRFIHVRGVTRGMDVTWRIEPTATGCHVEIEHDFHPRLPGLAFIVDRGFTRPIAGRTLATFKALAEAEVLAQAGETVGAQQSELPPETNLPS